MTATDTIATPPVTDEQRAEWHALHREMEEARSKREYAESLAMSYLLDHVEAGAMSPGEFGLPSPESIDAYRQACKQAKIAGEARARWADLYEQSQAHPYTAEIKARQEAQS